MAAITTGSNSFRSQGIATLRGIPIYLVGPQYFVAAITTGSNSFRSQNIATLRGIPIYFVGPYYNKHRHILAAELSEMKNAINKPSRVPHMRLQSFDYGANGSYFVTICTHNKISYFGKIVEGQMHLSELGQIANRCWQEIPMHFSFVIPDDFVVMPNHVHGIIAIQRKSTDTQKNSFGPQSQNLAAIIRGYKVGVKKYATLHDINFKWQARYFDHLIRSASEHENIRNYIDQNPSSWEKDKYFS